MLWNVILGGFAGLSAMLGLWQWIAALRFPLHKRLPVAGGLPSVTLLKPLKGSDEFTEKCLRSWLRQDYPGPVQLLFGVASDEDPVCPVVRSSLEEFPNADASLVICDEDLGANAKVSTLIQLHRQAKHDIIVVSDADVWVPPDLLQQLITLFSHDRTGLVSCFYRFAHAPTLAMKCEAIAVDADFWSQVLQSNSMKPMDFALGAVMACRRGALDEIGGFESLADCLADDYQLGHRIVKNGSSAVLCPVVVDCWDPPQGWWAVWKHQLRWARTVRVCQPAPYFFSILNNATLWPLLWIAVAPSSISIAAGCTLIVLRMILAVHLLSQLTPGRSRVGWFWLVPIKDLLSAAIWAGAFLGNTIEWRGRRMRLRSDGALVPTRG